MNMIWTKDDFRVCDGILVELRKNMDLGFIYDHGSQFRSWLHRLIRFSSCD